MVKRIVVVAVAALAIASPARAELATEEKLFVELLVSANFISAKCSGYDTDVDGTVKYADKIGVDGPRLALATIAATAAGGGKEYDRSALIPEVTRLTRARLLSLMREEKNVCANASRMEHLGFVRRK